MSEKEKVTAIKDLTKLIESEGFSQLNDDLKNKTLETFKEQNKNENDNEYGLFGKIFGSHPENISLFIAFLISFVLMIIGVLFFLLPHAVNGEENIEFWKIISPIITAAMGYIFGANRSK